MKKFATYAGILTLMFGLGGCTVNQPPSVVTTPEKTTVIHEHAPSAPHVTINTPPASSSHTETNTTTVVPPASGTSPDAGATTTQSTTTTTG